MMGYVLVLTCAMGQIQVNVECTIASMVDANVDAPSDLYVVSEQVYRLDNGDQKGGTSV